jgi:toxin CcdB
MRFLDVCANPSNPPGGPTPYLLIIQGDYVAIKTTRVVVPLVLVETVAPVIKGGLMPELTIEGWRVVVMTPELAGISVRDIGRVITNAQDHRDAIRRAVDILTGDF